MAIGRTKVLNDALVKIKSMLAKGPITLTYQIFDAKTAEGGGVKLSVGYPKEVLDACVAVRARTRKQAKSDIAGNYKTFSIILSSKQALTLRKGAKLVLKGKAELRVKSTSREHPEDTLTVFSNSYFKRSIWHHAMPDFVRDHDLIMENFTFLLNGKAVESAK